MSLPLHQRRLVFQDRQSFLQSLDLSRAPSPALFSVFAVSRSAEYSATVASKDLLSCVLYLTSCSFNVLVTAFSWLTFSYRLWASASSVSSFARLLAKSDSTTSKMSMIEPPAPPDFECNSGWAGCSIK